MNTLFRCAVFSPDSCCDLLSVLIFWFHVSERRVSVEQSLVVSSARFNEVDTEMRWAARSLDPNFPVDAP